jgi:hypothetical protein
MDTKKAPPNTDPIDIAESLDLKLDLLDLAVTGLGTKCEALVPTYEEDIQPILKLIWEAQAQSRELVGWVSEARAHLKAMPAAAA